MKPENRGIEYPTCDDGYRTDRTTRDGLPICPFCRRRTIAARKARAAQTTPRADASPSLSAPVVDHAALAAHDTTLFDEEDERVIDLAARRRRREQR